MYTPVHANAVSCTIKYIIRTAWIHIPTFIVSILSPFTFGLEDPRPRLRDFYLNSFSIQDLFLRHLWCIDARQQVATIVKGQNRTGLFSDIFSARRI